MKLLHPRYVCNNLFELHIRFVFPAQNKRQANPRTRTSDKRAGEQPGEDEEEVWDASSNPQDDNSAVKWAAE